MRKQSFLSLSVALMLILSGCTKEDLNSGNSTEADPLDQYSFTSSEWTKDADVSWSDGATTEPSRESELHVPELTQQMIDDGSVVLIYAKSNTDGSVQSMPAVYAGVNNSEANYYTARHAARSIFISHTTIVNGSFEVPNDVNDISFRYIIVHPNAPDPTGRLMTLDAFTLMSYKDVVDLLGIPE